MYHHKQVETGQSDVPSQTGGDWSIWCTCAHLLENPNQVIKITVFMCGVCWGAAAAAPPAHSTHSNLAPQALKEIME
ncbi:hypothetical protein KDA_16000 [Dictyobacter alpinus]|uniref:Uncharacterized protein n=1 Tax=Dictyobacter alpinus TaxID=2014873 RepID=A0A402B443_9CHLR|nr:hypothetical protein KDA_16000 [Dictyobacter alpinus]